MTDKRPRPPKKKPRPTGRSVAAMSSSPVRVMSAVEVLLAEARGRDVADTIVGGTRAASRMSTLLCGKIMQAVAMRQTDKVSMAELELYKNIVVESMDAATRALHVLNQTPDTQEAAGKLIEGQIVKGAALDEYQEAFSALDRVAPEGNG